MKYTSRWHKEGAQAANRDDARERRKAEIKEKQQQTGGGSQQPVACVPGPDLSI